MGKNISQRSIVRRAALAKTASIAADRASALPSEMTNKAAEALELAYAEGFCKAAEVAGVDPVELEKRAGLLDKLIRGGARYKELLLGNGPRMIPYRAQQETLSMLGKLGKLFGEDGAAGNAAVAKMKLALGTLTADGPVGSELRKVYATRAGTGVAGLLGLKALFGGKSESDAAKK